MTHYDWLISRLDAFTRKYYANKLLRGSLLLLICLLFYVLSVSVGEYFLYMPVWLRVLLMGAFVVLGLFALIWLVIIPLSKMARMGKIISHDQAAIIVGKHFPEISDKLLNILQLRRQSEGVISRDLIEASIDQKASQLSVIPITQAVDLRRNRKLLPYLLPLVIITIIIMVAAPSVFIAASERLLQPTKAFEKPAPFEFVVANKDFNVVRNTDLTLDVSVRGKALPNQLSLELNGELVPAIALENHKFQYSFRNLTEDVTFRLYAGGFYSKEYKIKVVQRPVLRSFKMYLDYPDYTGRKDEERSSLGDMNIPEGTTVKWKFITEHADQASLRFVNGNPTALAKNGDAFSFTYRFLADTSYSLYLSNKESAYTDSFRYNITVIKDQHPVIALQEIRDTVTGKQVLLNGTAGDDYAISRVVFHYDVLNEKNENLSSKSVLIKTAGGSVATFQHYFDIEPLNLQPGQKLNYYIEAWDNDGVHGPKSARSEVMSFFNYTKTQLDSAINANSKQINSGISNSAQQSKQMQTDFKEMQSKMLQSEQMDWQQQQNFQQMVDQQMKLQNQVENVKKRFEEQKQQSQQKEYSEDVKEKQDDIQKQLDNLLNNELKEQMKKLQELMQKLNKEQAFKTMQDMEQQNKLFNMDLERMKEMMKQLEMKMRLEDMANKMDDLANKQLNLKDQTDKGKKGNDALGKEQDGLKKELDKALGEDMKELKQLNEQSERPQNMEQSEQQGQQAGENMQQSQQSLQQNQSGKSSQSQSKAAQNLQQMAQALRQQASGMNMEEIEMDIRAVRQVLSNLMRLSFDQEQLMNDVRQANVTSRRYLEEQQQQKRLHSNSLMIRDSLFSLSKRLSKLSALVNKETSEIEANMRNATSLLENRRIGEALSGQQYVMTHTNNLALMLNEILSNLMSMQSKAQSQNKGACQKPGGMTPKPGQGKQLSDIITKQQNLGDAMQQMQNAKQRGQKPGEGSPDKEGKDGKEGKEGGGGQQGGKEGSQGEYGNAEQLARMAAQQSEIRRQLQELQSLLNSKGMGNAKELKEVQEQMDRNETDLVNKRLSNELIMRQRQILTRLLETEKALREQEQDDKRSSKSAEEISRPVPPELQGYLKDQQQLTEMYRTVPPQLKPYYRDLVQQYFRLLGSK